MPDAYGRTPITDSVKQAIADAFAAVPAGKRGALLILVDEQGARAMLAARLGQHWKVAAGGGATWRGPITGQVAIEASW